MSRVSTLLLPLLTAVVSACGSHDEEPIDVAAAVAETGWGDNVDISFGGGTFRFSSDGYPNHALNAEYIMPDDFTSCVTHPTPECSHIEPLATAVQASPFEVRITTTPQLKDRPSSSPFGSMGVMISGVKVYNPYEGDGVTVAMNGNFTLTNDDGEEVPFMDACHGHPAPHPLATYHYHGLPHCVTEQVDERDGPSHIIGFAFDGFPIYGDRDIDGERIDRDALDECNGIDSPTPEFPEGIYHYVLTEAMTVQSTVRCLHGKLDRPLIVYQYL